MRGGRRFGIESVMHMRKKLSGTLAAAGALFVLQAVGGSRSGLCQSKNAEDQPPPVVVNPGKPGQAPSDAVILFNGKDASAFTGPSGQLEGWTVKKGELVCTARHEHAEKTGTWDLLTKEAFGPIQLHVEFFVPPMPKAKGQARANSGIYLQSRYEVQILDSYENPTYPMGTLGAVYGHSAPLVNAARRPGEWQSYDIVFHPPSCNPDGTTKAPGTVTALCNGVLIQDHAPITPKAGKCESSVGPLRFQDHYHPDVVTTPIKLRNVWVRKLATPAM